MARDVSAADAEVESIKGAVARFFPVHGVVVTPMAITFQVTIGPGDLDAAFDGLRQELVPRNYIPTVTQEKGETLVHVQRRPTPRFARREVNAALLVVTGLTTAFFCGADNLAGGAGPPWLSPESIGWGAVFFSIPLLTILGAHEMGHYLVAKRYKVPASLPFFLPSIPPLGTFGAFISMRDPIPSRRALLDIGVSGPLIGFAIAIPVTLVGLGLSASSPAAPPAPTGSYELIQPSVFFAFLSLFFPLPETYAMHPMAFAGWVGLFVTAINLLPAGQLDGGHVARALLGNRQHYLSWAAVLALFAMGTMYVGWFIFGMLILMLGIRHPPPLNDVTKLDVGRKLVGAAAVAVLLLTFIPQPFVFVQAQPGVAFEDPTGRAITLLGENITVGGSVTLAFVVNNTGGIRERVLLRIDPRNLDGFGWTLEILDLEIRSGNATRTTPAKADNVTFDLNATERPFARLRVAAPPVLVPKPPQVTFFVYADLVAARRRH